MEAVVRIRTPLLHAQMVQEGEGARLVLGTSALPQLWIGRYTNSQYRSTRSVLRIGITASSAQQVASDTSRSRSPEYGAVLCCEFPFLSSGRYPFILRPFQCGVMNRAATAMMGAYMVKST